MANFPPPTIVRAGNASKINPFTVLVVANPALEVPWRSGNFQSDPITKNQPGFTSCVSYVEASLFGTRPKQAERLLGDPAIAPHVRFLSLFQTGLPAEDGFAFVAEDPAGRLLIPRRRQIADCLTTEGIVADIVYSVSESPRYGRSSAWFTSDDDQGPGTPFSLDGATLFHRHNYLIPGTVALHQNSKSMTALHEFHHAISSYTNGKIVDLYVDSNPDVNIKDGRPIRKLFCRYNAVDYFSDTTRAPLSYPAGWISYHCERHDPRNPAIMDDFWSAGVPDICQNDTITRTFVTDRVRAKISR